MYKTGIFFSLLFHILVALLLIFGPEFTSSRVDLDRPVYTVNLVSLQAGRPGPAKPAPKPAPVEEPKPEPAPEQPAKPEVAAIPETPPAPVVQPEPAPVPEVKREPAPEPKPEVKPEPAPAPKPEPAKEISAKPAPEKKAAEQPEKKAEQKPEPAKPVEKKPPETQPAAREAEPSKPAKPAPKPEPKPEPKLTPAQRKALAEKQRKEREQKALANELASFSKDVGDIYETGGDGAGGQGGSSGSGLAAVYLDIVAQTIKKHWSYPGYGADESLLASVEVTIAKDGTITGYRLVHSSGRESYDDSVLRAVADTERVPAPQRDDLRVITINFNPMER